MRIWLCLLVLWSGTASIFAADQIPVFLGFDKSRQAILKARDLAPFLKDIVLSEQSSSCQVVLSQPGVFLSGTVDTPCTLIQEFKDSGLDFDKVSALASWDLELKLSLTALKQRYRVNLLKAMRKNKVSWFDFKSLEGSLMVEAIVPMAKIKNSLPSFPGKSSIADATPVEISLEVKPHLEPGKLRLEITRARLQNFQIGFLLNSFLAPSAVLHTDTIPLLSKDASLAIHPHEITITTRKAAKAGGTTP